MAVLELDGASISYGDQGEGEPLLLVHGWIGSGALWDMMAPWLSERFRVIVPDLPGHGDSGYPQGFSFTLEGFSSFIEEMRDSLDLSSLNLVGHSMGGCIALHYAAHHPERVGKMVLIDTPARAAALAWTAKLPLADRLLGLVHPLWGPRLVTWFIRSSVRHPERLPEDFLRRAVAQASKLGREPLVETTRALRGLDLDREVGMVQAPVLILQGDHDPSVKPAEAARLRDALASAVLHMVIDCGHCPNYEYPELAVGLIEGFLLPEA